MSQHIVSKFALALTFSLSLVGCQYGDLANTGRLSFQFQLTDAAPLQFQLQAIPAETDRFEIEVSGVGLSSSRTASIEFKAGDTTQSHTMTELPTGSKTVTVKAFQADTVLAEASTEVDIVAGKTALAELDLQPVVPESSLGDGEAIVLISPALPLAVQLQIEISGEGLESPVRKRLSLNENQDKASLGILPAGNKQARIVFSTEVGGRSISSEPETLDFNVPTDGQAVLELSAAELLKGYEDRLDELLDGLTPVQLLSLLSQVEPARLAAIFANLPPAVQEKLRKNPTLSKFIDFAEPSPAPTAKPSAEPTPEPTEQPVDTSGLLMDVRFAMVRQTTPNLQLARPAVTELGSLRTLEAGQANTLFRSSAWGLFIRTSYTGIQSVNCVVKFTRNADGQEIYAKEFQLGTKITLNDRGFTGGVITFNDGQIIPLDPGAYTLKIQVTDPETEVREQLEYPLNFVAPLGA